MQLLSKIQFLCYLYLKSLYEACWRSQALELRHPNTFLMYQLRHVLAAQGCYNSWDTCGIAVTEVREFQKCPDHRLTSSLDAFDCGGARSNNVSNFHALCSIDRMFHC